MKRRSVVILVAAVSAVVIAAAAVALVWWLAGDKDRIAKLLPSSTVGYLRISNLSEIYRTADETGLKKVLLETLERKSGTSGEEIESWDKAIGRIESAHFSFHGVTPRLRERRGSDGIEDLDALLIVEAREAESFMDWLPRSLTQRLEQAGDYKKTKLYSYNDPDLRQEGLALLFASAKGKIFVSTDRELLEGVLEALAKRRSSSLASDKRYRKATKGLKKNEVLLYASSAGVMGEIEKFLIRRDLKQFRAVTEACGLRDIKAVAYAADHAGAHARLRVVMDPESRTYDLLSQLGKVRDIPEYLPDSTIMFYAAGVRDGKEAWRKFNQYIAESLVIGGAMERREEYHEGIRKLEKRAALDTDRIASTLNEVGILFPADDASFRTGPTVLVKVKDAEEARRQMHRWEESEMGRHFTRRREPQTTYEKGGVTVRAFRDVAWAIVDKCVVLAPKAAGVDAVITASEGKSLSTMPDYKSTMAKLPANKNIVAFVRIMPLLEAMGASTDDNEMMPGLMAQLRDLALGASVTVKGGIVELTVAQSQEASLEKTCNLIKDAILAARRDAALFAAGAAALQSGGAGTPEAETRPRPRRHRGGYRSSYEPGSLSDF